MKVGVSERPTGTGTRAFPTFRYAVSNNKCVA